MAKTSIPIQEEVRDELQEYRHEAHDSWNDQFEGMMAMLPTVEKAIEEGCVNCGKTPVSDVPLEETNGVVQWYSHEIDGERFTDAMYFCSPKCAMETEQEAQNYAPRNPDKVVVGGRSEMRTKFEGASFLIDGHQMEVGIPIPGAFNGTDRFGNTYAYRGEPVYIYHDGDYRQKGVIEDIIHEETHTGLILGHDVEVTMLNHPDEETRHEYMEDHEKWTSEECAQCGEELYFPVQQPPEECPACGSVEW